MKKPRKKYRPREVRPGAGLALLGHTAAAQSTNQLNPQQLRDLALGYSGALQALVHGSGSGHDLATLAVASNVALLLCEYGLGDIDKAKAAQDACMHIGARALRVGKYILTGLELRQLQDLIDLHDAQLASPDCTEGVLVAVLKEVKARAEAGHVLEVAPA